MEIDLDKRVIEIHFSDTIYDCIDSNGVDKVELYSALQRRVSTIVNENLSANNLNVNHYTQYIISGEIESPEAIIICKFLPDMGEKAALDNALDKIRSFVMGQLALASLQYAVISGSECLHCFPCFCNIEDANEPATLHEQSLAS